VVAAFQQIWGLLEVSATVIRSSSGAVFVFDLGVRAVTAWQCQAGTGDHSVCTGPGSKVLPNVHTALLHRSWLFLDVSWFLAQKHECMQSQHGGTCSCSWADRSDQLVPTIISQFQTSAQFTACSQLGRRLKARLPQHATSSTALGQLQLLHPFFTCLFQPVYLPSYTPPPSQRQSRIPEE